MRRAFAYGQLYGASVLGNGVVFTFLHLDAKSPTRRALAVTAVTSARYLSDVAWIETSMGSWGCPHEANGVCQKVSKLPCDPGMKGCVL